MKKLILVILALALLAPVGAQEKPAPTASNAVAVPQVAQLSIEQKQAIQLAAKDIEIAQLHAQQAAAEFNAAREALAKLLALYVPTGYQLNDKFELVKTPPPPKVEK